MIRRKRKNSDALDFVNNMGRVVLTFLDYRGSKVMGVGAYTREKNSIKTNVLFIIIKLHAFD